MPRVKQFNEDEVLYKAMELFWEKGYNATSMQDIVTCLGINRGSLYDTFGGKQNLFDKSLSLYCSIHQEGTKDFLSKQNNVKDGIRNIFKAFIGEKGQDIDRRGCFCVNSTNEVAHENEYVNELLNDNKIFYETLFYDFLSKGQENGEISKEKDIKLIAFLIFTLFSGIKD
jgi:TetR/AcrR family transcriptional regulator, transcriptional repressor for nem operon